MSVCRSYQTARRNSCSIVSGDVSNCSHMSSLLSLVHNFCYTSTRKTPKNYRENQVQRKCMLNEPASEPRKGTVTPVTVNRSPATSRNGNNMSGDNCGHSGNREIAVWLDACLTSRLVAGMYRSTRGWRVNRFELSSGLVTVIPIC